MKKNPGDIIILQRCTKNHDYRLYFPKIWHLTNVIAIFYLGLFFALLSPVTAQKIKISKKWKKAPGYIIILHKCSKTHDHILYCSWDMVCDEYNCYFSFWATFCPFTHTPPLPPTRKSKFQKNEKMPDMVCDGQADRWTDEQKKWHIEVCAPNILEISFYTCVPWVAIIWCMTLEIWSMKDIIFYHFGLFFFPFTPLTSQKIKIMNK